MASNVHQAHNLKKVLKELQELKTEFKMHLSITRWRCNVVFL